jgi:inorganic pyrophosphatase
MEIGNRKRIDVVIDVPRFGFIKHDDRGNLDYVSLLPCPFNYGNIPGTRSEEGDRFDAIVLRPRLVKGTRVSVPVVGVVSFMDAGKDDPKWICSDQAVTRAQRLTIVGFFMIYERVKSLINAIRRRTGPTRFNGIRASAEDLERLFDQLMQERPGSA